MGKFTLTVLIIAGDEEGGIEMTTSMVLMREFCKIFGEQAPSTRIVGFQNSPPETTDPTNQCCLFVNSSMSYFMAWLNQQERLTDLNLEMNFLQFFPDVREVESAKSSLFQGTSFKLDFLTKPSGLQDFGFSKKVRMADRAQASDKVFLVAYPYFNVNGTVSLLHFHISIGLLLVSLFALPMRNEIFGNGLIF